MSLDLIINLFHDNAVKNMIDCNDLSEEKSIASLFLTLISTNSEIFLVALPAMSKLFLMPCQQSFLQIVNAIFTLSSVVLLSQPHFGSNRDCLYPNPTFLHLVDYEEISLILRSKLMSWGFKWFVQENLSG